MSDIKIKIGAEITDLQAKLKAAQLSINQMASATMQAGKVYEGYGVKAFKAIDLTNKAALSINKLGAESQKAASNMSQAGTALSGIGQSLLTGGLLVAIPLIISGLQALGEELLGVSSAQKALNETIEGSAKAMGQAIAQVSELTSKVDLAKKGFLSKDEVVKEYNKTLGKTTGEVKSIEEAEQMLINKGPAYIKSMALKAAANFAFAKSGELLAQSLLLMSQKQDGIIGNASDAIIKKLQQNSKEFLNIAKAAQQSAILLDYENGFVRTVKEPKPVKVKEVKIKPAKVTVDLQDAEIKSAGIGGTSGAKGDLADELSRKMEDAVAQGGGLRVTFKATATIDYDLSGSLKKQENELRQYQESVTAIINDMIQGTVNAMAEGIGNLVANGGGLSDFFKGIGRTLGQGLKSLGQYLVQTYLVIGLLEKIKFSNPAVGVALGFALQIIGSAVQAKLSQTKAFASGTTFFGGGAALVGERGPEMVYLPQGSSVKPNNQLQAMSGGGYSERLVTQISGQDLKFILIRADKTMNSSYGI